MLINRKEVAKIKKDIFLKFTKLIFVKLPSFVGLFWRLIKLDRITPKNGVFFPVSDPKTTTIQIPLQ